jgi:homoserine kinase type II
MAVFTLLTKAQIENFLLEAGLVDLMSFEGILQGIDNTNYKLETSRKKYILTVFENRIHPDDIPYFIGYMKHLSDHGITCPFPVHRGKIVNKEAAIFSFLEGRDVKPDDITPALCHELGILLGRMHVLGQSFEMTRENSMSIDAWELRLTRVGDEARKYLDELQFLKSNWPQNLPKGAIHADLFPDNVFIKDGHIHGVIDFYFSATDFLAYDLAIVMNAWCFDADNKLDHDKWNALLSGYQSIRPLTQTEKDAYHILSRGAAMRFLSSRLHDLVFHDPKNLVIPKPPTEYIQKLEYLKYAKLF